MKTIFKFLPRGKKSALRVFRKKPIKLPSGKLQKLPAQKAPGRFSAMQTQAAAEAKARKVFGELPEFMGLSQKATGQLAAESLALQTANKKFFRTLPKELGRSRSRTESGILARTSKGIKVPKPAIRKAKQKGAMKAYGIATKKSEKAFRGTMEIFTTKTKASPFSTKTKAAFRPRTSFEGEKAQYVSAMRDMGFETPGFYSGMRKSGLISKKYSNYLDMLEKKAAKKKR